MCVITPQNVAAKTAGNINADILCVMETIKNVTVAINTLKFQQAMQGGNIYENSGYI